MKKIVALVLAMVMVLGLATTAFAAKAGVDYKDATTNNTNKYWDYNIELDDEEDAKDQTFATYEIEAVANNDKAVTWWDATPTDVDDEDDFDLGAFVKTDAKNATFVLVDGKNISYYMSLNGAKELEWDATAVKFTLPGKPSDEGDLDCNTMYNAGPVAGTYYFDAKEFVIYKAVKSTGAANEVLLNVDGVAIYGVPAVFGVGKDIEAIGHDYVINWVERLDKNGQVTLVPTKVYCQECKAEFKFIFGDAEDALAEFGLDGYVEILDNQGAGTGVYIAATLPVNHPALAAVVPSAPSADNTVESPKTFDAGIAMYVGMSVMAAAGSAVVLKKKD